MNEIRQCILSSVIVIFVTGVIFSCEPKTSNQDGPNSTITNTVTKIDALKSNLPSFQQRKVEYLDSEYLRKGPDGNKKDYLRKTRILTHDLLLQIKDSIINWDVRIVSLSLESKPNDAVLLKTFSPDDVVSKDPSDRKMSAVFETTPFQPKLGKFWVTIVQESNKVTPGNGLAPEDPVYKTLASLTDGITKAPLKISNPEQRVTITGKVLGFEDYLTAMEEHNTILYIRLINIH